MPENNPNKRGRSPEEERPAPAKRQRMEPRAASPEIDDVSFTSSDWEQLEGSLANRPAGSSEEARAARSPRSGLRGDSERAVSEISYGSLHTSELDQLDLSGRGAAYHDTALRAPQRSSHGDNDLDNSDDGPPDRASPSQEERRVLADARTRHEPTNKSRPAPKPFALKRPRDKTYNRNLLKKISAPGVLAYPKGALFYGKNEAPRLPLLAASHQIRDLMRNGQAVLSEKDLWDPGDPPKSRLYVIAGYDRQKAHYRKLDAAHLETLSIGEQRHLGVLPEGRPTGSEMTRSGQPRRSEAYKSNHLLMKIGQPGYLASPPSRLSGLPLLATSHQVRNLLRAGCAALSEEDLWGPGHPPKSKLYVIDGYEDSRGRYRELEAAHYKTLEFDEQRHLGVLPDWSLTDREMFELGMIERNQVVLTPTASTQSSRSQSPAYEERLARASASVSHRSDVSSDSEAPLPVKIPIGLGQLKPGQFAPNFEGWTAKSIRQDWLPKLPKPADAAKRSEAAGATANIDSCDEPPLRGLDGQRQDHQRQGRG